MARTRVLSVCLSLWVASCDRPENKSFVHAENSTVIASPLPETVPHALSYYSGMVEVSSENTVVDANHDFAKQQFKHVNKDEKRSAEGGEFQTTNSNLVNLWSHWFWWRENETTTQIKEEVDEQWKNKNYLEISAQHQKRAGEQVQIAKLIEIVNTVRVIRSAFTHMDVGETLMYSEFPTQWGIINDNRKLLLKRQLEFKLFFSITFVLIDKQPRPLSLNKNVQLQNHGDETAVAMTTEIYKNVNQKYAKMSAGESTEEDGGEEQKYKNLLNQGSAITESTLEVEDIVDMDENRCNIIAELLKKELQHMTTELGQLETLFKQQTNKQIG